MHLVTLCHTSHAETYREKVGERERERERVKVKVDLINYVHNSSIFADTLDNEEALFNPWCPGFILLESIRKKCACGDGRLNQAGFETSLVRQL